MPEVWPFVPQREFTERLEWKTDVIKCRSSEQRILIRNVPRTTINHEYHLLPTEQEAARGILEAAGTSEFIFPLWADAQPVTGLTIGQQTINVDTTQSRYKVGGYAFFISPDGTYEAVAIASVAGSTIGLVSPYLANNYSTALVAPCLLGLFDGPFRLKKVASDYTVAEVTMVSAVDLLISGVNPYPPHDNTFVMTDRPLLFGTDTHERTGETFKNYAGPLHKSPEFTFTDSTSVAAWSFDTSAELWNFRLWLYYTQGKLVSFFMPRWTRDFSVLNPIGTTDTSIIISRNSIKDDSYTGAICVVEGTGTQHHKNVLSIDHISPTQSRLNIDEQFGANLSVSDIELVCRMPRMRFDTDAFEFGYQSGGSVNVRAALVEVP